MPSEWTRLLGGLTRGRTVLECGAHHSVFAQGQPADAVYFLVRGKVKLAVTTHDGREAIVATLGAGECFGEGCLAGQPLCMATAIAVGECALVRVEKQVMAKALNEDPAIAQVFLAHLLARIVRYEADLVDQLFNSSEKRLARILVLLSHFTKDSRTAAVVPGITQEHLAQMVGTTRSRINLFMNKFRKRGFIHYTTEAGFIVNRGLLEVLQD